MRLLTQFLFLSSLLLFSLNVDAATASRSKLGLSSQPSASEIWQSQFFDRSLTPSREPTRAENQALVDALERLADRTERDDFSSLTTFLADHPDSPWAMALWTQLGSEYARVGRYSRAIAAWQHVWKNRRLMGDENHLANANRAGTELAALYAQLGKVEELRPLLAQLENRPGRGVASSSLRRAQDGLWSMEFRPEISFRCGPVALNRLYFATDRTKAGHPLIEESQSTAQGFSAAQLAQLSRQIGLPLQVAFRSAGSEVLLPAVAHWKVGHYSTLVQRDGTLLRAEDPTLNSSKVWLSEGALEEESSGYFLVRAGPLPRGWREASAEEAAQIWGRGRTLKSYDDATSPNDEKNCYGKSSKGMAQWSAHLLLATHSVEDTPVGYDPPVGPSIPITASYSAMNGWPDFGLPYSNISQEWRLNWVVYLTDDPLNAFGDIRYAAEGGGSLTFTDFNSTNQSFGNLYYNRSRLIRVSTNHYEIHYPDGWKKIFQHVTPGVGTTRRIFMTAVVDPAGNAATVQYDRPGRVSSITDTIGQRTQFFYERPLTNEFIHPNQAWVSPFIVTRVVDPFGRTAQFDYGSTVNARLGSITDSIGLVSSFRYDYNPGTTDLGMTNLITPYGTTSFKRGKFNGIYRANWVEITHPNGEKERIEFSENSNINVPSTDPIGIVPKGVPVRNSILFARNTYHWDRKAYAEGFSHTDYSKARIYHWTHGVDYTTAGPMLESYKAPLEHRVWLNYQGQVNPTFIGNSDRPTSLSRTMIDGTTATYRFDYNPLGNATRMIDPLGRTLSLIYDSNQVDLAEIRQTRGTNNALLRAMTYNAYHQPLSIQDANGLARTYTYNARGQVLTETNPQGGLVTYTYDTNGYLQTMDGPLPGAVDQSQFTWDPVGRLRTAADEDGYSVTYDYDSLDRITRVTYPDGTYDSLTYQLLDLTVFRDRAGRETRYTYDSMRQLVSAEDPLNRVTRFEWCGCGSLDAIIDPMGRVTRWLRDVQGRPVAKVHPDGSMVHYEYDRATGWLKSVRDEQNQVTLFDYNLDGTLRQKRYLQARVPTAPVKFAYDPDYRRLATMEDGTGLTRFIYHPVTGGISPGAGQLASIDGPLANDTITFNYDELGRMTNRSIAGVETRWQWDPLGRLIGMTNSLGAFSYTWDGPSFRVATGQYPNGIRYTNSYFSNLKDRLQHQTTYSKPDGSLLRRQTSDYDVIGQLIQSTEERSGESPVQWVFSYDAADQLTNAVAVQNGLTRELFRYVYDQAGNRVEETTLSGTRKNTYNLLNQLKTEENASLAPSAFDWDVEGRLVSIQQGRRRTEFHYDGFHRRTRMVEKEDGNTLSDRSYLWCQLELCEERSAAGPVLKRYSQHGIQAEVGASLPSGRYVFTSDRLGSVRELTDVSGVVRAAYNYSPFGQQTKTTGDLDSDFGYTGHYTHSSSGLNLAPYRSYDPARARWLNRDPLGEGDGLNLYAYVSNDPLNWVDPLGLEAVQIEYYHEPAWVSWDLQPAADFAAGFGDTITTIPFTDMSLTGSIRDLMGTDQFVNHCSTAYFGGMVAGTIADAVLKPGAALKTYKLGKEMHLLEKANKMGKKYEAAHKARQVEKAVAKLKAEQVIVIYDKTRTIPSKASKMSKATDKIIGMGKRY